MPSWSCPVCCEAFAASAGASFALHVASCVCASPPSSPSSPSSHCPRCYRVYSTDVLPHELLLHERECRRVNTLVSVATDDDVDVDQPRAGPDTKRHCTDQLRGSVETTPLPRVALFPSKCFVCGSIGCDLFHCRGSCARSAHSTCLAQLQATGGDNLVTLCEKKQATRRWTCAQCLRGLQVCRGCGFLGQKGRGMQKCSVRDCGYYFHERCRLKEVPESPETAFICPRHTCSSCKAQETDMKRCKSCSLCMHMTHLDCPKESGAARPTKNARELDEPVNFFDCPRHDGEATMGSSDANNSLRLRFAMGDVVLVLELNNALLPLSVKTAAPDAANQWGVVVSAEEMEPRECGHQLLQVRMFADDNVLAVPNQYAMRVTTAADFSRPVDLLRHCVQRHAMVELQLRQMEMKMDDTEAKRILLVSTTAFAARLEKLGVTAAQAMSDAEEGLARWRQFQDLTEPRQYDGHGESAPIYLYIDTRGSRFGQQALSSTNTANVVADAVKDVNEDVSMTDADTDSGEIAINGSTFGPPHLTRPKSAGKSPHEAAIEQSAKTEAILEDTRLTRCSRLKQSQTSIRDTIMTDFQDAQPENNSQS